MNISLKVLKEVGISIYAQNATLFRQDLIVYGVGITSSFYLARTDQWKMDVIPTS